MEDTLCDAAKRYATQPGSTMRDHHNHVKAIPRYTHNRVDNIARTNFYRHPKPDLFKPLADLS